MPERRKELPPEIAAAIELSKAVPNTRELLAEAAARRVQELEAIEPVLILWPYNRPRYMVTVRLTDSTDGLTCVGFSVYPLTDDGEVGSAVMRSLPVAALIDEAIAKELDVRYAEVEPIDDEDFRGKRAAYWQARAEQIREQLARAKGSGPGRRYPPGHLERVAEIVREARARHEPPSPAVAAVFGISSSAASNQITRAKAQGLLEEEN